MPLNTVAESTAVTLAPRGFTLYEAEEYLQALLDTEALVTAEQEEEFQIELARQITATQDKREAVGRFILQAEALAAFCLDEAKRIHTYGHFLKNRAAALREYVLRIILKQPLDAKGKFPKLAGRTLTMAAHSNPPSVEITNPDLVPARFKLAIIQMPMETWRAIVKKCPGETAGVTQSYEIDKAAIRKAIVEEAVDVPGADLNIGKYHLRL